MDLLNENQYETKKTPKSKKIVLILLILSIIGAIGIIIAMLYVSENTVKPDTLKINGQVKEITEGLLIKTADGIQYISLRDLANLVNYEYYSNEYPKEGEDSSKCYIKNNKLITSFEMDSNQIYKYEEGTNLDYQYYTLNYNIIIYNNKLYIALADLQQALNIVCTKDTNNLITINTTENLVATYNEKLKDTGYALTEDQNNLKALSHGYLIVNKNGIWSVLDTNLQEIVGSKYKTIYFDEKNLDYIVSNTNGQYGIISTTGSIKNSFKYDSIEVLNYENEFYKVKNNNKYGIMKSDGTMLTDIIYDEIGYPEEPSNKIVYTLIIPELDGKSGETIVVKQNNKYGLIYLETGKEFIKCDTLDKIYSVKDYGTTSYKIEIEKQVFELSEYIKIINTHIIELN